MKYGVNIIAVRRDGKTNVSLTADFRIQKDDVLIVIGESRAMEKVQKL